MRTGPAFGIGLITMAAMVASAADRPLNQPPEGFTALFNGKDLAGWKSNDKIAKHWTIKDGVLHYDGKGTGNLISERDYGNFILHVDWKIQANGDSGIYLRGKPQVQIWDPKEAIRFKRPEGSGGLFNNKVNPADPTANADKPVGEWNTFIITMVGDKVTVELNGKKVVDSVTLENYPKYVGQIPAKGTIELQDHHSPLEFRNIFVKELP